MAVRRWGVRPDPQTGVVDRQAVFDALADAAVIFDRCGGMITLVGGRSHTDLDGEMVTTGAIITWMDRADAKAQPEHAVAVLPQEQPGLFDSTDDGDEPAPEETAEIEQEDVSAIPEPMR